MELTLVNVILIVAMVAVSMLLGAFIGQKKGYIKGLFKGKEDERTYFLSKIPPEVAEKIINEEWEKFCGIISSNDEDKE